MAGTFGVRRTLAVVRFGPPPLTRQTAARRTTPFRPAGKQHHLEQHGGRIHRRARDVIPKSGVEVCQIDFVVEQMIERVLERAGQQLAREVDAQELRVRIDGCVAGDGRTSTPRDQLHTFAASITRDRASSSVSTLHCTATFPTTSLI